MTARKLCTGDVLGRFEIRGKLGEGGMGVVFEAFDTKRNACVALKVMKAPNPDALYKFKREFRSLSDLNHPNLVTLFELQSTEDRWLFTMELVRGTNLRSYVRPFTAKPRQDESATTNDVSGPATLQVSTATNSRLGPVRQDRLRATLPQLARAICALHDAGKLHRDIKPSNILVDNHGRVAVCDFGLVSDLCDSPSGRRSGPSAAGTMSYMSPEQVFGKALTEASDWYSFGAVLYELLTGRPPFVGRPREVLVQKRDSLPVAVQSRNADAPDDLAQLCDSLLNTAPATRAGRAEVTSVLKLGRPMATGTNETRAITSGHTPLGRDVELERLHDAQRRCATGQRVVAVLSGKSGIGKSTIMQRFLWELEQADSCVLLTGRCFQRESVPYKAFDDVMDTLTDYLVQLSAQQVESLLPPDARPLAQLFPVLRRIELLNARAQVPLGVAEPHEVRRRAFDELRELICAIGANKPVVIAVDDLQWADADSLHLLRALLSPPNAPAVLIVATFRNAVDNDGPTAAALCDHADPSCEWLEIPVAPLTHAVALELANRLTESSEQSRQIAAEAKGNPFYVGELARYMRSGANRVTNVSLEAALSWRVSRLGQAERDLLAVVSVAGHPIAADIAVSVCDAHVDLSATMAQLRDAHLLCAVGASANETVDVYHARVRETLVAQMSAGVRQRWHYRLAEALEARGNADAELVLEHLLGAGEKHRAARYAEVAARRAGTGLAFDRAVRLYELALTLNESDSDRRQLQLDLASALVKAGRGAEAAQLYLDCLDGADANEAVDLRRRAAQQWLQTGHFARGLETIQQVLDEIGMRLPSSTARALSSLVWQRSKIRLRGLGFEQRPASEAKPQDLRRLDILWTATAGIGLIDNLKASVLQAHYVRACLRTGEPVHLVRGFSLEAAFASTGGSATAERTSLLLGKAREVLQTVDAPHAHAFALLTSGIAGALNGRWSHSLDSCTEAQRILRSNDAGISWELEVATWQRQVMLYYLGEFAQLRSSLPALVREAEARGNLHTATSMRTGLSNCAWLIADDICEAQRHIAVAERDWTYPGFHLQHHYILQANVHVSLYAGKPEEAIARVERDWRPLRRSLLRQIQLVDMEAHQLRAKSLLAILATTGDRSVASRITKDARRIERIGLPYATGFAQLLRAGLYAITRRDDEASKCLAQAEAACETAGMAAYTEACRWRQAELSEDDDALAAARSRFLTMGVVNPERFMEVLAPGFAHRVSAEN